MRVPHKSNSSESPSGQERNHAYAAVEESEDEIAQDGIPLKQYPTSGSRTRIEDKEAEHEANRIRSIELRDHEEDEHYDPASHEGRGNIDRENIQEEEADMASWVGQPAIKGSSESMRMALLTLSLIGLQFTWGIEMTCMLLHLLLMSVLY